MRAVLALLISGFLSGCYNSPDIEDLGNGLYRIRAKTDFVSGGPEIAHSMTGNRAFKLCPNGYTEIAHDKLPDLVERTTIKCL